ncbi:unnamed protein product [Dracunculus medinensis]|uniref:Uncharacterized protein n=1 Tax=Dracunculus medinensis TaxID=318479 RepID=A0A0N4UI24_DRAME|nr:unnamed protein product [Dracunculus medinensis]
MPLPHSVGLAQWSQPSSQWRIEPKVMCSKKGNYRLSKKCFQLNQRLDYIDPKSIVHDIIKKMFPTLLAAFFRYQSTVGI